MTLTHWILIVSLVVIVLFYVVYDIYAALDKELPTISQVIWKASAKHPVIPFVVGWALGFVCGHLFWKG